MNYSTRIRRSVMAKRVIASWVIVGVVGLLIGGVSGYALKTHITAKDKPKAQTHTSEHTASNFEVYGAFDDRCFTEEISLDWGAGDLDFTPLDCKMPEEQQEFTYYLCTGYNLDFSLVMALMQHESSFKPDVVSKTGDYGLMQINSINHEELTEILGVTDYLDPYENIRAGCFILRKLFEKYGDTNMVLMAYNMGENGARRLWEQGVYNTKYSDSILNYQQQFNEQLEGDTDAGKLEGN